MWAWGCSPPTSVGRAPTPRSSWRPSSSTPHVLGPHPETCLGPRPAADCPWGWPSGRTLGPTRWWSRRRGLDQPVQRRGHRLRLRDRPPGRRVGRRGARRWWPGGASPSTTSASRTRTADYYKVANAFVRLISNPQAVQLCVGCRHALGVADDPAAAHHVEPHAPRRLGPAEVGYRAMEAVAHLLPDTLSAA